MDIAGIFVGTIVLLFGRKLFWVFVGILGFIVAFDFTSLHLVDQSRLVIYAVAIAVGLLGILAALFIQRIAFGIAGFLAGGYTVTSIFLHLGWVMPVDYEIVFLIGGIFGALAALLLTDWGLIVLSSLVGAVLITDAITLDPMWRTVIGIALAALGIYAQRILLTRKIL